MRAKHKAVPKVEKEALKACVGEGEQQQNGSCDLLSLFFKPLHLQSFLQRWPARNSCHGNAEKI